MMAAPEEEEVMKARLVSMVVFLASAVVAPVLAEEPAVPRETPQAVEAEAPGIPMLIGGKLARGVTNFCLGWTEVPKQIYLVSRDEGWLTGMLRGPVDGLGWFTARTVAGMYEIFTFPLPLPPRYQPLVTPDYVWQQDQPAAARPPQTARPLPPVAQPQRGPGSVDGDGFAIPLN
jgi:putative exosortase-associated protein (TIGR04073 family)